MRNWTIATTLFLALWVIAPVSAHAEEKAAEATEEAASEEKGGTEAEPKEADKKDAGKKEGDKKDAEKKAGEAATEGKAAVEGEAATEGEAAAEGEAADEGETATAEKKEEVKKAPPARKPPPPWTYRKVISYTGLTVGTMSTLVGVITLATPADPDQQILGWTATGVGVAMLATGALYSKLESDAIAEMEAKKAEEKPEEKKTDDTVKSF